MIIYTDGSAKGNGKAINTGGWGYVVVSDDDGQDVADIMRLAVGKDVLRVAAAPKRLRRGGRRRKCRSK